MNLYQFVRTPQNKVLGVYSHPLFRRGEEARCKHIKRPSTKSRGSLIKERRLRGTPPEIISSDIVSIEGKFSGETYPKRSIHRSMSTNLQSIANLQSIPVHKISSNNSIATKGIESRSPHPNDYFDCNDGKSLQLWLLAMPTSNWYEDTRSSNFWYYFYCFLSR